MRRYTFLFLTLTILAGCKSNVKSDKESINSDSDLNSQSKNTVFEAQDLRISNSPIEEHKFDSLVGDTFNVEGYRFIVQPIEKEIYLNLVEKSGLKPYPSSSKSKIIENFNEKAWRINDSILIIKLTSGLIDTIADSYPREGLGFSKFLYVDYLKELKSHLIAGKYYEASSYVLVSDSTGALNMETLSSNVAIDSTQQRLITYEWDGFAFHSGGFTVFDITQGKLDEIFSYRQKYPEKDGFLWSLSDVYYLSPNELIYVHQVYPIKNGRIEKFYAKMAFEKSTSN